MLSETLMPMDAALTKPDHLDPETWAAIEQHRARFAMAAVSQGACRVGSPGGL